MRDWGVGGKYQQITQAITGALQGVLNGDLTQALANGSAPFLAEAIKNATTNPDGTVNTEANLAAHAILGALLSQANGNSALAGGLGALTAEAAAKLIKEQIYGDKAFEDLTEAERQNISALAQIAAGVAGGLAGDSSSDAAQGAIAGKNAVENNYLNATEDKAKTDAEALLKLINDGLITVSEEKKKALEDEVAVKEKLDDDRNAYLAEVCKVVTSAECNIARADLDAAYKSYFESLSPEDKLAYNAAYATYATYLEGYKDIESLLFGLNIQQVEADSAILAQRISENLGVDLATAENMVLGMRITHDLAGIAVMVVGPKVVDNLEKQGIGVPSTTSTNKLNPVQQYDSYGNEIVYRTMSIEQFKLFERTGIMPPTTETSVSPVLSYSSKYDGVTVKITVNPGTFDELQKIGIAANSAAAKEFPNMSTQKGKWMSTNTRFKVEGGQMTTQLGQGKGIDIFNKNIVNIEKVK